MQIQQYWKFVQDQIPPQDRHAESTPSMTNDKQHILEQASKGTYQQHLLFVKQQTIQQRQAPKLRTNFNN